MKIPQKNFAKFCNAGHVSHITESSLSDLSNLTTGKWDNFPKFSQVFAKKWDGFPGSAKICIKIEKIDKMRIFKEEV
ncbi:MAG: hypothetical protein Q4G68_05185 [Planctomycetia bacterium]|nr:hypothetical protein [Planctomycetia bacterium]